MLDQAEQIVIVNPLRQQRKQDLMVNRIKATSDVGFAGESIPGRQAGFSKGHGMMRAPSRPEGKTVVAKVRLKHGLEKRERGTLHNAVPYGHESERTAAASILGDIDPFQWATSISEVVQFITELLKVKLKIQPEILKGDPVETGRARTRTQDPKPAAS
jgi:hypothetical protein